MYARLGGRMLLSVVRTYVEGPSNVRYFLEYPLGIV